MLSKKVIDDIAYCAMLVIVNDRNLHKEALRAFEKRYDVRWVTVQQGMLDACVLEDYKDMHYDDKKETRRVIRALCVNHFTDVYQKQDTPNITTTTTGRTSSRKETMNTYNPSVEDRRPLVFGSDLSFVSKNDLMAMIREAQAQIQSFNDLPESKYVDKQIAEIRVGIDLCLKQLDK